MGNAIRMGTVVAVVLVALGGSPGARADDPIPASEGGPIPAEQVREEPARQVFEPGAASVEPGQSIDEAEDGAAHRAWVDSIHSSP